MFNYSHKKEEGVSVYLAIIILGLLLAMALGLNAILVSQIKMTREMGDSVVAIYAADTGIEKGLMLILKYSLYSPDNLLSTPNQYNPYEADLNLDGVHSSHYSVKIKPGADCGATFYCIDSIGSYNGVERAVRLQQ